MKKISQGLEKLMVRMIDQHPFYAEILTNFRISENPKMSHVAGVYIKNQQIYMEYNPKRFLGEFPPNKQIGLFQHEILHIMNDHLGRAKEIKDVGEKDVHNVAMDLAINGNLINKEDLPEWGWFYDSPQLKFPPNLTYEQYLSLINKNEDLKKQIKGKRIFIRINGKGESNGTLGEGEEPGEGDIIVDLVDDHDLQDQKGDGIEIDKEMIKEIVKKAIEKAAGTVPGNIQHLVDELLKPPLVNWKRAIRMFVNKNVVGGKERSWKRFSKRMPGLIKGKKKIMVPKLGCLIDASGSISDSQLDAFCNEIKYIHKKVPVHVIVFDSEVHESYEFEGKFKEIKARGGTAFGPAFEEIKKIPDISAVVCATDMYAYDINSFIPEGIKPPQILWLVTSDGDKDIPFGKMIRLEI